MIHQLKDVSIIFEFCSIGVRTNLFIIDTNRITRTLRMYVNELACIPLTLCNDSSDVKALTAFELIGVNPPRFPWLDD